MALLCVPLARLLGANEPALLGDTSGYMAGFIIGAPASMGALILVPFLQIAGQSNLLIAAVLGIALYVWKKKGGLTREAKDILLLRRDFGVPEEDRLEANVATLDEVMAWSQAASEFCSAHGGDKRLAAHLALCVEEMGGNIVTHGFAQDGKNRLSMRLRVKDGRWTLRFRDDCMAFDPISHVREREEESLGIRLAMRMADEARYTYSMNLNNLTLILRQIQ